MLWRLWIEHTLAITKFVLQWRIHANVGLADHPRDHVMAAVAAAEVVAETEAGNVMADTGPVAVHTAAAATNAANGVILVVIAICAGAARIANVAAEEAGAEAQVIHRVAAVRIRALRRRRGAVNNSIRIDRDDKPTKNQRKILNAVLISILNLIFKVPMNFSLFFLFFIQF